MKLIIIFSFLTILFFVSCNKLVEPEGGKINENIKLLMVRNEDNIMGVSFSNKVYSVMPLSELHVNKNFDVVFDTLYDLGLNTNRFSYIKLNENGTKALLVKSKYVDVSRGALYELDLNNMNLHLLRDNSYNISSAVYWNGDDSKLIYYRYGNENWENAGYYLLDKQNNTDSLILNHLAPCLSREMLNGFDLHPDNSILLIPAVQAEHLTDKPPKIIEYNMSNGEKDTLHVEFNLNRRRIGLWLRYNKNGEKILYCNFPHGSYYGTAADCSEVGIIERATLQKTILDVNTNPEGKMESIQLAPTWSSDEKSIVYGSGPLSWPSGVRGTFSLFVLVNID